MAAAALLETAMKLLVNLLQQRYQMSLAKLGM